MIHIIGKFKDFVIKSFGSYSYVIYGSSKIHSSTIYFAEKRICGSIFVQYLNNEGITGQIFTTFHSLEELEAALTRYYKSPQILDIHRTIKEIL